MFRSTFGVFDFFSNPPGTRKFFRFSDSFKEVQIFTHCQSAFTLTLSLVNINMFYEVWEVSLGRNLSNSTLRQGGIFPVPTIHVSLATNLLSSLSQLTQILFCCPIRSYPAPLNNIHAASAPFALFIIPARIPV